jgi:hypothetical protein
VNPEPGGRAVKKIRCDDRRGAVVATLVVLAVAGILGSGCASSAGLSAPVDTVSPGWESRFKLEWKVTPDSETTRKVTGYLYNQYGETYRIRLLVKALDASGAVVSRRVQQAFGGVSPFERDYFEFDKLPVAERYTVSVYSYDRIGL